MREFHLYVHQHQYVITHTGQLKQTLEGLIKDLKGRKCQINLEDAPFILTPLCTAAVTKPLTTPLCGGFFKRTSDTLAHRSHCSITPFSLFSLIIM